MKQLFKQSLLLCAALCAAACSMDKISTGDTDSGDDEIGYLTIGGVGVNVDTETTEIGSQAKSAAAPATRVSNEVIRTYLVSIIDAATDTAVQGSIDGEKLAAEFTYGSLFEQTSDGTDIVKQIALAPGTYYVTVHQPGTVAGVGENCPYYAGTSDRVTVRSQKSDPAGVSATVTCKLANIKTSVEHSADLQAVFQERTDDGRLMTKVSIAENGGENSYTFEKDASHNDGPFVYFKDVAGPDSDGNEMKIVLSGYYYTGDAEDLTTGNVDATKYKAVSMTKTLQGVKAATWRKISIDIDHNTTGNLQFVFTVESYVYDDTIDVDITTLYAAIEEEIEDEEEEISDPDAPAVAFADGTTAYTIDSSMYDADLGYWSALMKIAVTAGSDAEVASYYALFDSDNAALLQALDAAGYTDGRVELYPTNAASNYCKAEAELLTTSIQGMTGLLQYAGTHTMKIVATDSRNRTSYTTLTINVASGSSTSEGPTVVWSVNGATSTSATITGSESVTCNLSSKTGFTGIKVAIESDNTSFSSAVADLFGTTNIDLFNLVSAEAETNLRSLGFLPIEAGKEPADDDQYRMFDPATNTLKSGAVCPYQGETSVPFDISAFMGALSGFPGSHRFTLTATDAEATTSGSIVFIVNN